MTQIAIFILIFLVPAANSFAQLNESDTALFQLRASLTGNYQQGNVEVLTLRCKIEFSAHTIKNVVFKSQNSTLYQSFYNRKADNDLFSRNFWYHQPYKTVYPFAIAFISANYRRQVNIRYFTGAGATVQVLQTPLHVFKVSANAVYENTHFSGSEYNDSKYNGSNNIRLWRAAAWMGAWHYLSQRKLRLYYDAYWQPAFNDARNYRWQIDIGFDFPFWKGLAFNALYNITHENVVSAGVKRDDRILTMGLSYNVKTKHK